MRRMVEKVNFLVETMEPIPLPLAQVSCFTEASTIANSTNTSRCMKNNLITLLALGCSLGTAFGTVYVYDDFSSGYTADATVVGQGPAATGFTGNWTNTGGALVSTTVDFQPRTSGLSYTSYSPSGAGSLEGFRSNGSHSGAAKRVSRDFSYTADTSDFYISFLIQSDSTAADADSFVRLQAFATADADRDSFFSVDHATNLLDFSLGGTAGLTGSASLQSGANLVVVRASYDFTTPTAGNPNAAFYDKVDVWVNPTLSVAGLPSVDTMGAPNASGFGIMRSFNGSGAALAYDSLIFEHSLDSGSITLDGIAISAVPEPGTYVALFGAAALALVMYRRRKC